ncbi:MAG TPA: hypothetical protein VFC74_00290 [Oscillospiraceae bacterium]|nr:hypothetical protein [Oscillospiraceae bacterium]
MIERVYLYDLEIVEIEGEFKEIKRNAEVLPCMLTNHALYVGKRDGLLETSLTSELYNIIKVFQGLGVNPKNIKEEDIVKFGEEAYKGIIEVTDEDKIARVIYLGLIGANPQLSYSLEDFILKYHDGMEEKVETYMNLINSLASRDNQFKAEFEKKTSQRREKGEKK